MRSNRISLKTAFARQIRGMKIWHQQMPGRISAIILSRLFTKGTPFVTVFLSARILNALVAGRESKEIWTLVGITLGVTCLLGALGALLNRWKSSQNEEVWHQTHKILDDKQASMDFVDADSQRIADLAAQIKQNHQWSGWGLARVLSNLEDITDAAVTALCGIALSAELFVLPVREGSLAFLNHPLFVLLILCSMAASALLSGRLANYADGIWSGYAASARLGNRIFGAYGFFADDHKRAMDIRIYRQDKITTHYMEQGNIFTEDSPIAARYRGMVGLSYIAAEGMQAVMSGFIYLFVCLKAWAGAFPIGSATQYIGAVTGVFTGISDLIVCLETIRTNGEFLKDTYEYLDTPNSMYQGSLTTEKRSDRQYEVEFRDVSFKYPGSDNYALRHVSMKFKVGRRLAVVGRNGSGKTTFIKLLCRLYDPTEGQILLNGIDIRKYRYDDYMAIFSIVFQDFQLFAMPLGENVATSASYDRDRARDCLIKAGFGDRLKAVSLDTHLYKDLDKNGVDVSGGEAQKIAIARALYKDAPFIILDEPTAALDPVAEAEIYSKFNDIAGDKTAIYISHRLSSCKFCDEIAVFDGGQVVQLGTHEDLVADKNGKYYELWHAQAQYYAKEA